MSLALGLLICEALARMIWPPIREASWYHYDPDYGMRHRSGLDQQTNMWGDGAPWRLRTNRRGFRGDDWPDQPDSGVRRAIVAGDSFTFANAVEEEDTFVTIAQEVARETHGQDWEVVNLGVSAWGPQNVLAYLSTEGASIGGSCLILAFFEGNDVADGLRKPLYKLEDARLERARNEAGRESPLVTVRQMARRIPGYDLLLQHSQLVNVIRRFVLNELANRNSEQTDIAQGPALDAADLDYGLALNQAVLAALADLAENRFGAFGVISIPMLGQMTGEKSHRAMPFALPMAKDSRRSVLSWSTARGIPYIDVQAQIRRQGLRPSQLYFQKDFHLNEAGNRFLGRVLGEQLPRLCDAAAE